MVTLRRGDGYEQRLHLEEQILFAQRRFNSRAFLQEAVAEDGDFGEEFEKAVYTYQGIYGLTIDGVIGPEVWGSLLEGRPFAEKLYVIAGCPLEKAERFGPAFESAFGAAQVNTGLRQSHFTGQVLLESADLKYMEEIWGPTEAQLGYEGREDLGNTQEGDGYRFRGRGPFMLTGRKNYTSFSEFAGEDFVANPDRVSEPKWGVLSASWYWREGHPLEGSINQFADQDDVVGVSAAINYPAAAKNRNLVKYINHLAERRENTEDAKSLLTK